MGFGDRSLTTVSFVLVCGFGFAQESPCPKRAVFDAVPEIGETIDQRIESDCELMTASAQTWPSVEVEVEEITYTVAFHRKTHSVTWVSTASRRFETPDGVSPGDSYDSISHLVVSGPHCERGWGEYTCFESGWCAYLSPRSWHDFLESLNCEEKDAQRFVGHVFQR
jgi:hypothetical protein